MKNSLERLKKYSKEITLYPGHGEVTTLDYELTHNPKHKKYQEINVSDSFKLEISNEFIKTNDYLFIKPYILLWSSGR